MGSLLMEWSMDYSITVLQSVQRSHTFVGIQEEALA